VAGGDRSWSAKVVGMAAKYAGTYDSPVGVIHLVGADGFLEGLWLDSRPDVGEVEPDEGRLDDVRRQLDEYFAGERTEFDVELRPTGTPFQLEVWEALREVGYGQTASYVDIARRIGRPAASRAVGAANGRNPISIIVPCHRVIGSTGKLVGYGWGVERKQWLLDLEQGQPRLPA
jgi:methylated-DNA-[protein]-cysteine S-methyltransferase